MNNHMKNSIKKFVFEHMNQDTVDLMYKIYSRLKYPTQMQKKCSYGQKNPDKTMYVIRPRIDGTEGLMSLFINVAYNLCYAEEYGYEPVVDFENYYTQYADNYKGKRNAWDFFFTQPSRYSLNEVYESKNVILSGLEISWYKTNLIKRSYNDDDLKKTHDFLFKKIDFSENVKTAVNEAMNKMRLEQDKTLGLYLRGTDYIALKPSGHPVQPTAKQAMKIVDEYLEKYDIDKVFVVTEDANIYSEVKYKYGEKCVTVPEDSFISDYEGTEFLSHDKSIEELSTSPYRRGLNYLVKLVVLSRCAYFVGGDTMGSWATMIFAGDSYRDKYVFDLGIYGK